MIELIINIVNSVLILAYKDHINECSKGNHVYLPAPPAPLINPRTLFKCKYCNITTAWI